MKLIKIIIIIIIIITLILLPVGTVVGFEKSSLIFRPRTDFSASETVLS
jgi:hypothetical protein